MTMRLCLQIHTRKCQRCLRLQIRSAASFLAWITLLQVERLTRLTGSPPSSPDFHRH
jgi:hypothetical protein